MEFLFTIDVSDNDQIVGEDISAALTSADIEDDDNVQLCSFDETITCGVMTSNNTGDSTRLIRITGSGTLDVIVDNNDPETNRRRHILAGNGANENPYVASFELIANNESVKIDEFTLNVTDIDAGSRARFLDSIDEVVVHDEDGNVIASERVSTLPLDFNNVGLIVEEGSTNVYVTIVADRI
jgi:hypothetical protein